MENINILYIGRNPEILETVVRLLNKRDDWNGIGVQRDDEARELFANNRFQLVLFGPGIEPDEETALCEFFVAHQPGIKLVQHYGGGSGLLLSEVMMALNHQPMP